MAVCEQAYCGSFQILGHFSQLEYFFVINLQICDNDKSVQINNKCFSCETVSKHVCMQESIQLPQFEITIML